MSARAPEQAEALAAYDLDGAALGAYSQIVQDRAERMLGV